MSVDSRPVVLVTGAARRVGRAIALELAAHGFDVAVHSHQASDESIDTLQAARAAGARAEAFVADLADEVACRALLPAVAERMGRIDAVVNNASRFEYDGAGDCSYASMAEHWQVNTAAPVLLAAALHQRLSGSAGRGCVVNLLDQKLWNPNPDHFSYTLSKAALEAATTLQAQAFAPTLRVVGVAPGVTLPSGPMDSAEFVRAHAMTPLRRSSTPEDVARAVRFLIESPAITGTTLLVDGGQHLSAQPRDVLFLAREGLEVPHWTLHPRLAACRRVFLKSYALPVRIGVHDFERVGPQRLLIDVDLYVPLVASTPREDRLDEVVDYDFIRHAIAERVAQGHIGLQETLCDEIAARMLAHPQVLAVRVSTEKPDVYADCAAVGVEVFHIKESDA